MEEYNRWLSAEQDFEDSKHFQVNQPGPVWSQGSQRFQVNPPGPFWSQTIMNTVEHLLAMKRKVHVIFTASWCDPCKKLKTNMIERGWCAEYVDWKKPVMFDDSKSKNSVVVLTDWDNEEMNKYKVTSFPWCVVLTDESSPPGYTNVWTILEEMPLSMRQTDITL